ncbi:hypothetical protein [Desertibacillus haloalkaliphilus]|uniref:hypothetical protein n=1 Tax=Desertibacillus haloalkaliphilus TaxID=1328930 RepID=UPI001C2657A4|nr:hypothetical protein [Desertibacillus haloalkaliphilus]MBU8905349.1 hypothetical protein [Desertibacillus haloalkaliphilus]
MVESIVFAFTVFVGWVIFDFTKHKKLMKEQVLGALVVGLIAGAGWYLLGVLFS